jgi:hypothetical protein
MPSSRCDVGVVRELLAPDRPRPPARPVRHAYCVPGYAVSLTVRAARAADPLLFPPFASVLARRRQWARLRALLGWPVHSESLPRPSRAR